MTMLAEHFVELCKKMYREDVPVEICQHYINKYRHFIIMHNDDEFFHFENNEQQEKIIEDIMINIMKDHCFVKGLKNERLLIVCDKEGTLFFADSHTFKRS